MSRTYRRKNITKPGDLKQLGALYGENERFYSRRFGQMAPLWDGDDYESYREEAIRKFHSDLTWAFVDYSSAPKSYRKIREREYRQVVRRALALIARGEEEPIIPNRPQRVAWDYW